MGDVYPHKSPKLRVDPNRISHIQETVRISRTLLVTDFEKRRRDQLHQRQRKTNITSVRKPIDEVQAYTPTACRSALSHIEQRYFRPIDNGDYRSEQTERVPCLVTKRPLTLAFTPSHEHTSKARTTGGKAGARLWETWRSGTYVGRSDIYTTRE